MVLRGRAFELADGTSKSFNVTLGGNTVTITATANGDGSQYTFTSSDTKLQFVSPVSSGANVASLTIDPSANTPLISLVSAQSDGPISVVPSAAAKDLGFQAGNFDFEMTSEGFQVISSDGEAAEIDLDVSGLPGQILSMKNLPPEDLIVVLDKEGARRLSAQYQLSNDSANEFEKRNYQAIMADQVLGKVEIVDT